MRRLVMWNLVTIDGFFEGPKSWDIGWHAYVVDGEFEQVAVDQLKSADMLLFGRVTYQGMAAHWPSAAGQVADLMNGMSKVVFSKTLEKAEWRHTRLVKERAEQEVPKLKQQTGRDLLVFGSAVLCSALTAHGLIDEYRLCVVPVVLGAGTPLFTHSPQKVPMTLLEARPLASGGVILRYQPGRGARSTRGEHGP